MLYSRRRRLSFSFFSFETEDKISFFFQIAIFNFFQVFLKKLKICLRCLLNKKTPEIEADDSLALYNDSLNPFFIPSITSRKRSPHFPKREFFFSKSRTSIDFQKKGDTFQQLLEKDILTPIEKSFCICFLMRKSL